MDNLVIEDFTSFPKFYKIERYSRFFGKKVKNQSSLLLTQKNRKKSFLDLSNQLVSVKSGLDIVFFFDRKKK